LGQCPARRSSELEAGTLGTCTSLYLRCGRSSANWKRGCDMAEISYPFAEDTPGGGSKMVSQIEWQNMAHLWASDRIDFQFTQNTYSSSALPFYAEVVGANILVQPGSAWVGGFYYRNDAPHPLPAPTNNGTRARYDLIVLRADMSTGSVNLARIEGVPSTSPQEPAVQRTPGGIWEMPLWAVLVEAQDGGRTFYDRRRFNGPGHVWTPQNGASIAASIPPGNFVVNMDTYNSGYQYEGFRGRDGFTIARHLGKRWSYTPTLFTVTSLPVNVQRKAFWRYIAPGTVHFSMTITNPNTRAIEAVSSGWTIGFNLPVATTKEAPILLKGMVHN